MWSKRNKLIGEQLNPFTGLYDKVYDYENSENVWVEPKAKRKSVYSTDTVAICSGSVIEIKKYSEKLLYGYSDSSVKTGKRSVKKNFDFYKRDDNINASKMHLRRLINANVQKGSKFVTLTFRDNLQDVDFAKILFKNFVKKINYRRKKNGKENLKYVYVIEFQKRGAIHFHSIFFNMGFVNSSYLQSLWEYGFLKINLINNIDNVGAYVVKYMQKDFYNSSLDGHDMYGRSKGNLQESVVIKEPSTVAKLLEGYKNKIVFTKLYTTQYRGNIEYIQINLKRNE